MRSFQQAPLICCFNSLTKDISFGNIPLTINTPERHQLTFFSRNMWLFEMLVFIIRLIWILSNTWLMFICLKRFVLGDSRYYIPPILVPSSAKCIATQILVISKLNGRKDFIWEAFSVTSFVPARNYLFKASNLSTRITRKSCLILTTLTFQKQLFLFASIKAL